LEARAAEPKRTITGRMIAMIAAAMAAMAGGGAVMWMHWLP
jgi:hypothetical protein